MKGIAIDLFAIMTELQAEAQKQLNNNTDILKDSSRSDAMRQAAMYEGAEWIGGLMMLDRLAMKLKELGSTTTPEKAIDIQEDMVVGFKKEEEKELQSNVINFDNKLKH